MAQLVQSFVGDTALRLQDEEFIRRLSFGTDWIHLRIAVSMSVPQATGTLGFTPFLSIGLCQGTALGVKSASTTEWVGLRVGNGTSNVWTFNAGPPTYLSGGPFPYTGYKQNSTYTMSAFAVTGYMGVGIRTFCLVDIVKTATGYIVGRFVTNAIPVADIFGSNFEMFAANENQLTGSAAANFATNGLLDSASVYWSYPSVGLEISELLVIRYV
jgi:hypothetical protein